MRLKKMAKDLMDCLKCHRPHIPLRGQLIQYGTSNVTKDSLCSCKKFLMKRWSVENSVFSKC